MATSDEPLTTDGLLMATGIIDGLDVTTADDSEDIDGHNDDNEDTVVREVIRELCDEVSRRELIHDKDSDGGDGGCDGMTTSDNIAGDNRWPLAADYYLRDLTRRQLACNELALEALRQSGEDTANRGVSCDNSNEEAIDPPVTESLAEDVSAIGGQNQELSHEIKFVQNLIDLLENYRSLLNRCLNTCEHCSRNQDVANEFQDLEHNYIRDLNFAKELIFDNADSFRHKMSRLFTSKTATGAKKSAVAAVERKYELIDAYLGSDDDEEEDDLLGRDSDYDPNVDEEALAAAEVDIIDAVAIGARRGPKRGPKRKRKAPPKKRRGRPPKSAKSTAGGGGSGGNKCDNKYAAIGYGFPDNLIEEIDEIIDNFDDTDDEGDESDAEDTVGGGGAGDDEDRAYNPKKSSASVKHKPVAKRGPKKLKKGPKPKRNKYDKLYKCDSCEYTHRKLPNLESHKNKVHLNIRPFKCDKCGKCFTGKPFLDKHRRFHSETYHHCDWPDCHFKTKYMNNLKEHRMRHEKDRQFRCAWPGCGALFYNNRDLTQHMKSHEEQRDYRCDWPGCEATFKRHTYLSRHKQLHLNPDTAFPCVWPGCGKSFNTRKKLENHSATHAKQLQQSTTTTGAAGGGPQPDPQPSLPVQTVLPVLISPPLATTTASQRMQPPPPPASTPTSSPVSMITVSAASMPMMATGSRKLMPNSAAQLFAARGVVHAIGGSVAGGHHQQAMALTATHTGAHHHQQQQHHHQTHHHSPHHQQQQQQQPHHQQHQQHHQQQQQQHQHQSQHHHQSHHHHNQQVQQQQQQQQQLHHSPHQQQQQQQHHHQQHHQQQQHQQPQGLRPGPPTPSHSPLVQYPTDLSAQRAMAGTAGTASPAIAAAAAAAQMAAQPLNPWLINNFINRQNI